MPVLRMMISDRGDSDWVRDLTDKQDGYLATISLRKASKLLVADGMIGPIPRFIITTHGAPATLDVMAKLSDVANTIEYIPRLNGPEFVGLVGDEEYSLPNGVVQISASGAVTAVMDF